MNGFSEEKQIIKIDKRIMCVDIQNHYLVCIHIIYMKDSQIIMDAIFHLDWLALVEHTVCDVRFCFIVGQQKKTRTEKKSRRRDHKKNTQSPRTFRYGHRPIRSKS